MPRASQRHKADAGRLDSNNQGTQDISVDTDPVTGSGTVTWTLSRLGAPIAGVWWTLESGDTGVATVGTASGVTDASGQAASLVTAAGSGLTKLYFNTGIGPATPLHVNIP